MHILLYTFTFAVKSGSFVPHKKTGNMATTFKAVVYAHHKKEDGTYNVKIRVTHNRVRRHIATNIFVTKEDLTRGLKIKSQNVLDKLKVELNRYTDIASTITAYQAKKMSVDDVLKYISTYTEKEKQFELDFIAFSRNVIKETFDAGRDGTALSYETAINSLVRFLGRDYLSISEITVKLLEDYCAWLKKLPPRQNRVKGDRAPSLYLGNIRILHNKAKDMYNDEDAGIIRIPLSPFKKFKVPKSPLTRKRSIAIEKLQAIMSIDGKFPKGSRVELARDVFLLSFGLIGMNTVDLFKCTQFDGDRITYDRAKTHTRRADNARISIKVEPELQALVEKYRDKTGKRVFNFYQRYADHNVFNANVNRGLKIIGKMSGVEIDDLEFYAARHTWATLARNKAEIDKATIHEALNHVDEQMRITDIYIDKDYSRQDAANRKVLDLVSFKCPE